MAKSRSFSIYLLKHGFNENNALVDNHNLIRCKDTKFIPNNASLFITNNGYKDPWWKDYWGIEEQLKQRIMGAIVFIFVDDRYFAITFGHTYHNLKPNAYEYDFGIRATLNAADPNKIKSTDVHSPESAKKERIQSPVASDLSFFDINTDESIVKKLACVVRSDLKEYFSNVSGANNIRISSRLGPNDISDLCSKLLKIYADEVYKKSFPQLHSIRPIDDPDVLGKLHEKLLDSITNRESNLILAIPEILDEDSVASVSFSGFRSRLLYDDVSINNYFSCLDNSNFPIESVNLESLKKHCVIIKDENGYAKKKFTVYDCLLFDCELSGDHFHLCESNWYKIDKDYLNDLNKELDPFFCNHDVLRECSEKSEGDYNKITAKNNSGYICLDRKNIAPKGQYQVEPCDIFTIKNGYVELIHVKVSSVSKALSHLFNQGVNSVELLKLNSHSKDKLHKLIKNECNEFIDGKELRVIYGIITKKDKEEKSKALPLFSRISLRRALNSLRLMGVNSSVVLIKDKVSRS